MTRTNSSQQLYVFAKILLKYEDFCENPTTASCRCLGAIPDCAVGVNSVRKPPSAALGSPWVIIQTGLASAYGYCRQSKDPLSWWLVYLSCLNVLNTEVVVLY